MEYEKIKSELREIVNTPASALTAAQKRRVRAIAKSLGVEFEPKSRCASCYHDAAMQCFTKVQEMEAKEGAGEDPRKYILKPGVDVYFGSIRVNETTLTDELAEYILARGFKRKNFVKICE